jgi:diacylglycerol kinase family enzyme
MSVALDGEILRIKPPLRFRSRPQAIRLMMPADSTGAGDE